MDGNAIENTGENPPMPLNWTWDFQADGRRRIVWTGCGSDSDATWVWMLVGEPFQIRIPFQFADVATKPIGEVTEVFDNGLFSVLSCCHRVHALRLRDPFGNCDFVAIFHAGLCETRVVNKELKNMAG